MEFNELLIIVDDEPLFESALLLAGDVDPKLIRIQLSRWVKSGKILQVRRGLYALASPYRKTNPHPFAVANRLQKASYVSLQSALAYYSLIPDIVQTTTSVSTGRTERLDTALGVYEFRHIKTELLFGYQLTKLGEQSAFLAVPEKAFLDLIYLNPGVDVDNYLLELRLQNLENLNNQRIYEYANSFGTPRMLKAAKTIQNVFGRDLEEIESL